MPALRVAPARTVDELFDVNKLFHSKGLESVALAKPDQVVFALYADDALVGALYSAAPVVVAQAFVAAGNGLEEAATKAGRIQSIEAMAVDADGERGSEYHAALLEAELEFVQREFGTEVVLARIAADDHALVEWYMRWDFDVCRPGQGLEINGAAVPVTAGYLDAWTVLASNPQTTVAARP